MAQGREHYERIAVEEGFTIAEIAEASRVVADRMRDAGRKPSAAVLEMQRNLLDLGEGRLAAMDRDGIARQLLVLSSPGVQVFDAVQGSELAALANDRLAAAVAAHPHRLAGLAAVAPQDPARAAGELERAVRTLGLKGAIINSHTHGEYLDEPKFWPIFEVAEALGIPIYLHPREPSPAMAGPLAMPGFGVGWGYGVETGTHLLRLIAAGVFAAFPRLRVVVGHLGEGLPFSLDRIDNRYRWEFGVMGIAEKLARLPGAYFRENVVVTSSGMNFQLPLMMTIAALGIDSVLFAADWPFEDARAAVDAVDALPLSDQDKEKLYRRNAERVFGL